MLAWLFIPERDQQCKRKEECHTESAVKGEGPVPSEWLVSVINSCLLAAGQDPAAYCMSATEG